MKIWLLALVLLLPGAAAAQPPAGRAVAITFDDLPFAAVPSEDDASLTRLTARLLQHLQAEQVPAVGFVNEAKLYREGSLDPARVGLLRSWLQAGFELGNHTASHPSLNRVPLDAFEADLLQGETVTRPLMQSAGRTLRWFRHPFLHLGTTPEVRVAFQDFLAAHGYTAAPVTVNNSEWVFAVAYARAQAEGDSEAAQRIGAAYVPYMDAVFARAEQQALDLFGRPIPHVLVLHANALNADHFDALAAMLRQRGYRFIELADALQDSAYASTVGYSGFNGESWLELWSRQAGLRPSQQPPVPGFVTQWAGPAASRGY
ncbi:polysaccharide deacetylase family protein [Thiobacillus sp.]|uniref:polysaccharide deacetylase family protein n=1 Tax=Thiobacillus sp. TaxID=924 RepID=UPI00286DDD5D|nr:polysaccharide deacetylase family protein [Thiobacillus sp.]